MIRLMGILTGSAIAVGILIVGLGMPEFSAPPTKPAEPLTAYETVTTAETRASTEVAIAPGMEAEAQSKTEAGTQAATPATTQAKTRVETHPDTPPEIPRPTDESNNTIEPLPLEAHVSINDPESIPPVEPAPPTEPGPKQPQTISEAKWYAFWSPFRSEIAADGFVAQLQRTTGLDYRVVKLKPGVYEVAFAYLDESDIQDKLARISTATGLDLSGG